MCLKVEKNMISIMSLCNCSQNGPKTRPDMQNAGLWRRRDEGEGETVTAQKIFSSPFAPVTVRQIKLFYFIIIIIIEWNYNNWIIAEFCKVEGEAKQKNVVQMPQNFK